MLLVGVMLFLLPMPAVASCFRNCCAIFSLPNFFSLSQWLLSDLYFTNCSNDVDLKLSRLCSCSGNFFSCFKNIPQALWVDPPCHACMVCKYDICSPIPSTWYVVLEGRICVMVCTLCSKVVLSCLELVYKCLNASQSGSDNIALYT